ncbi:hyaluronidase-1 isoform X1 [Tachyglossus aculeatus]|uniref:hyaluronidase-1 isoform X1 n=2 Tax=Tachyglossus aculeatus TaxID=9261 RepID=UPI0018F67E36|nr:hyaluronidase-1 isoform X1 [Tachyglossus aculeatus]
MADERKPGEEGAGSSGSGKKQVYAADWADSGVPQIPPPRLVTPRTCDFPRIRTQRPPRCSSFLHAMALTTFLAGLLLLLLLPPPPLLPPLPPSYALLLNLPSLGHALGGPVVSNHPFTTIWNADTHTCLEKFHVDVDLDVFDVVANPGEEFMGQEMTIFYSNKLGLYPSYTAGGQPLHGGLPQNASLASHLAQAQLDIQAAIPKPNYRGLAVIDWESWRPLWALNWDSKEVYRERSRALVKEAHPDWSSWQVEEEAAIQFQTAARAWMSQTLQLGQSLRPRGLWGFYGFPACYNYDFKNPNYTGACPAIIRPLNQELQWLWNRSRALYPSIYLPSELEGTEYTWPFVRERVREAFRMAMGTGDASLPVLPYAQIYYDKTNHFLPLEELENSIGESVAQGVAGVVLWVSWEDTHTKESCENIKDYVDGTLGPFILNLTSSTQLCSQALCSGHGRCARRRDHPRAFLYLNSSSFSIHRPRGSRHLVLTGKLPKEDQARMMIEFECHCYKGWRGEQCERKE